MTDKFLKNQIRWLIHSLAVVLLIGFGGYQFVVKHIIIESEVERLELRMADPTANVNQGLELYRVLTDGTLASDKEASVGSLSAQETLDLVFESQKEGGAYAHGWVYWSRPNKLGTESASGWLLGRFDASKRLARAAVATALVLIIAWGILGVLFYIFQRRLAEALAGEIETIRERLGIERAEKKQGVLSNLRTLASTLVQTRAQEDQLMQEMGRFTAIAFNAKEGIFLCNSDGQIQWANAGFEKMIGFSLEHIQESEPFFHIRPDLNDPLYIARIAQALSASSSVSLEFYGERKDGVGYWATLELRPLPESGEKEKLFYGIQTDITEQRKATMELEEVSRRFALAMESANVGIWDWDVKRDELVWDEHTYELYGVSCRNFDPSYRSWMACMDPEDSNRVLRLIDQSLAKGKNLEVVACIRKPDGSRAYIRSVARAFLNDHGEVQRYLGIASDVTEEHIAKHSLIEQKDEAETLAVQLANAVKESKKAALEADKATRAKSAFLAMMSHEIRTPMNGVIGMASLLLETELDEHQRDYLNTIRISGDTLLTLINDILDYSKIESGKLDIEKATFSVRDCVEEAADLLASKAAEKGIDLLCRVDLNTPSEVVGDITRLRQILVNLIGNAVKFTEVGEVEVCVHAPLNGKIHFSVRDTGIGIPADRINRLFEVFSQVDSSTTRKYGGSGLGLSISKQLANLMGGEMWVESSLGKGSVFHFDIAFDDLASAPADSVFSKQAELDGMTALLVEPNAVLRDYLSNLLSAWGLRPHIVPSIDRLTSGENRGKEFDFLVLDGADPTVAETHCVELLDTLTSKAKMVVNLLDHGSSPSKNRGAQSIFKPCRVGSLLEALQSFDRKRLSESRLSVSKDIVSDSGFAASLPLRILVADDNSVNQKVARMMLKKFGYHADLVANGVEAVEAVKRHDYDLIFMDCQMPEMDGFEATRIIRDIEADRSTPRRCFVYALTANVRGDSLEMSKDAGMDGFLAKPIKLVDIKNALTEISLEIASRN
ncbi:ATP-binding protein [Pelagicoccus albus]|uniref:histidine kinase n=1 Tax=Pelagicoccus albus TaxID=415222 RepID=A0A7X1B782_9BACT|nr:ATP-binding protein [Pelagicoccus albus]MBC2606959.1 response regulator [Pelagicoccus albus]